MIMGRNFDRANEADKLHIKRKQEQRAKRIKLENAASDLLKACKENKMSYKQIIITGLIIAGLLCWLMHYLYSVVNELPLITIEVIK